MGVAEGLSIAIMLANAIRDLSARLSKVGGVVAQAQAEGRDLTDAEANEIRGERHAALANLEGLVAAMPDDAPAS